MSRSIDNPELLLTCIRFPKSLVGAGQKPASLGFLTLAALAFPLLAGVEMQTGSTTIVKDGTCQQIGFIKLVIDSDAFPHAQPRKPVYLRLRLDGGATLCDDLVPPGGKTVSTEMVGSQPRPIFLALSLHTTKQGIKVVTPPETCSILRWKSGEPEIWLVVRHPTGEWLRGPDNLLRPPDREDVVVLTLGIDGAASATQNLQRFDAGRANLTSNTNDLDERTPTSTEGWVDVSGFATGSLGDGGTPLRASLAAYWGSTGVDETDHYGDIHPGTPLALTIGSRQVATVTELRVEVDPPVAIQGVAPVELHSVVTSTVAIAQYEWIDLTNEVVIGTDQTLVFDPIPTETTEVKVTVTDVDGNTGAALSLILVDIGALDPNGDGENNILDLYFKLPDWYQGRDSILDLLHINIGN